MARIIIAADDETVGAIACQALLDADHIAGMITVGAKRSGSCASGSRTC